MKYLLDTNVISEIRKKRPNAAVLDFLRGVPKGSLHLSCLSFGELREGIERKRKKDAIGAAAIAQWVGTLESDYLDYTLPINTDIAKLWGIWSAQRSRPIIDTLLAATAIVHGLTLVTRNISDVHNLPVLVLNPWTHHNASRP